MHSTFEESPPPGDELPSIRDRIADGLPVQPEAVRRRWITTADRWRTRDLKGRSAAEHVYRILAADLDSGDATGRERVTWLLRNATILDETLYEIALRFEAPSHRIDRHLARLTAAQCLGTLGRLDESMQLTELLLDEHFEVGTPHELNVLGLYVTLLGWQRREIEMLAASRALERRTSELGVTNPAQRVTVRHKVSLARQVLELPSAALHEDVAELARFAEDSPETVRWRTKTWVEGALADLAATAGNVIRARMHLANLEELAFDGAATPWSFADLAPILGRVELVDGNAERTLQIVEKARLSDDRSRRPHTRSRLSLLALEAAFAIENSALIEREIGFILMGLDPKTSSSSECTGVHWRTAYRLAQILRRHGVHEKSAETALSLAADALLSRVEEIERIALSHPSMFANETTEVIEFRRNFATNHPELLEPLRTAIAERGREWASLFDPHGQLQVCAWCLCARDDRGSWLPVGHLMPSNERISVSHGICERCAADQLEQAPH